MFTCIDYLDGGRRSRRSEGGHMERRRRCLGRYIDVSGYLLATAHPYSVLDVAAVARTFFLILFLLVSLLELVGTFAPILPESTQCCG